MTSSDFLLDGYIKNKEDLLMGSFGSGDHESAYIVLERLLKENISDLGRVNEIFSKYVKGIGVLNTEDGLVIMRDRNGFRTGWIGNDVEDGSYLFTQENFVFGPNVFDIKYEEIGCGEAVKIKGNGDIEKEVLDGPKNLIYDTHELAKGLSPLTNIFEKSVYQHRKNIGSKMVSANSDLLDSIKGKKTLITCFPESPRPAALGFWEEAVKKFPEIDNDEVFYKNRYDASKDQQRDFSVEKEFPFSYNEHLLGSRDVCISIDDSLMMGTRVSKFKAISESMEIKPVYMTMQVPVIYSNQVGYFTKNKNLLAKRYIEDIYRGKISTIKHINDLESADTGVTVLNNNSDDFAEAVFGDSRRKVELDMPDVIRNMPSK